MNKVLNQFLLATAIAVVSVTVAQAEVNMASWGGAYTESQQKAYADTWDAGTVNFIDYNGGLDEARSQVASGTVTWDVVDVFPDQARTGCDEGLFEKLDRSMFTPAADGTSMDNDIMVEPPNDCVVPNIYWSYMAFYEDGIYSGNQPSTISDFFDVENFPGKRGIHTWPNALIEMALYADGVAIDDIYDEMSTEVGINRAFSKLDTIKDHAVFWSSGAEPVELVKSGEVAMALAYNGRVGAAILNDGEKFVSIWDGQVLEEQWFVLMSGAPNAKEAREFLIHASSPASQAEQARYINYGPMRSSAFDIIKAGEPWYNTGVDIMEHMPNRFEVMENSIISNPDWWAVHGESISERYTAWMDN